MMSSEAPIPILSMNERRLLGVMVEKAKTTPDVYPMSVNSLVTGANQKSNRDPIMNFNEEDIENALAAMQPKGYVTRIQGGRVERWKHNLYDLWSVNKVELAILAELLLRGPQTEGELRQRASRMEPIDDLDVLRAALKPLVERKLVQFLGPEGRRGTMITHGFHSPKEVEILRSQAPREEMMSAAAPSSSFANTGQLDQIVTDLEQAKQEIAALKTQMREVQETLAYTKEQLNALKASLGG
jgi:uncharacterized protein YceH (UPF0502 family)